MRTPTVIAALLLAAGRAWADVPVPVAGPVPPGPLLPVRAEVPPLTLPPLADPAVLPAGVTVSRPLAPVTAPVVPAEEAAPPAVAPRPAEAGPARLPASWENFDFLLWWTKAHPLPPLVTATRLAAPPVLGGPNTTLLLGGRSIDNQDAAGGRFTLGWAVTDDRTLGVEATYLFLGTRTYRRAFSDRLDQRYPTIGRPIIDPDTGREAVVPVSYPGAGGGLVGVSHSTRVTGWEVGGVAALYAGPRGRVTGSLGYRYFMLNEGLRVEQTSLRDGPPEVLANLADQFDTSTRFHGGQVGLTADLSRGSAFVELGGKLALGKAVEVVRVSGQGDFVVAGGQLPLVVPTNAGVLGLPSNTGRTTRSVFAVLPEGQLKIGYRFSDTGRVYVGYTLVYLSDAVRPGDQVDRTIRPSQTAVGGGQPAAGPELAVRATDFWVQGLVIGLEYRY
jgi:hypothetical protein